MHPHDYLLAVAITLTQPVISGITAPLGINGELKRKFGYIFHFSNMEEARVSGMSLPDGLIFNEKNKILLIPECKSSLQEKDSAIRLLKQLKCYSSEEFINIMHKILNDFEKSEIVIITFTDVAKEIQLLLKAHSGDLEESANIVIWVVEKIPGTDTLVTKLFSGEHLDKELNSIMSQGVKCRPPAREFLSSPDIPDSRFTSSIGRRLLVSLVAGSKTVTFDQFLEENKDMTVSLIRLKRIIIALFRLVPELGTFEKKSGTIKLKTRVDYLVIQAKLQEIAKMSSAEFHRRLGEPVQEDSEAPIRKENLKPTVQVSLLDYTKRR